MIKVFQEVEALRAYINAQKVEGNSVGYVPTMGALHEGHLSLINASKKACDITVCSIFVNPTQFDNAEDLEKYPRILDDDQALLESAGCEVLFAPSVAEVYPSGTAAKHEYDFGYIVKVCEGASRTGHFEGVAQVVRRLLEIVEPHSLFMGQKDYQQCMVINKLLEYMQSDTELVICPIIRETDGLAMSSRNRRLSEAERAESAILSESLRWIKNHFRDYSVNDLTAIASMMINKRKHCKTDYIELRHSKTLEMIEDSATADQVVVLAAAYVGPVRLIDNMIVV